MKKTVVITSLSLLLVLSGCEAGIQTNPVENNLAESPAEQLIVEDNSSVQVLVRNEDILKNEDIIIPLYMENQSEESSMNVRSIELEITGFADSVSKVSFNKDVTTQKWLSSDNYTENQGFYHLAMVGKDFITQDGIIGELVIVGIDDMSGTVLNIAGNVTDGSKQQILTPYQITL